MTGPQVAPTTPASRTRLGGSDLDERLDEPLRRGPLDRTGKGVELVEQRVERVGAAPGEQIETELAFSSPSLLGQHIAIGSLLEHEKLNWGHALLVEITYTLEDRSFSCTMFLLMPGESIEVMKQALDDLLDDF